MKTHPGQSARRTGECSPHKAQEHIQCSFRRPCSPCEGGGVEMSGMVCAVVVAGLMLASCSSARKMSSDVAARDSMHRERREVAADSLCQKAMRDRVLESAAEVKIVIEEEFWGEPYRPARASNWEVLPSRGTEAHSVLLQKTSFALTGGPECLRPSPVARRRTTITAKKDVKEKETETEETMTKTITKTEELEDSVAEEEEHVKEEREGRTRWPWSQVVWVVLCAWVVWKVWRKGPPQ